MSTHESFHCTAIVESAKDFRKSSYSIIGKNPVGKVVNPQLFSLPLGRSAVEPLKKLGEPNYMDQFVGYDVHG
jgi:hypothetical protein